MLDYLSFKPPKVSSPPRMATNGLNGMTGSPFKVLENRLRRMLARRGFKLVKSRVRDSGAIGYGGYLIAGGDGIAVAGGLRGFGLDDVERWLEEDNHPERAAG